MTSRLAFKFGSFQSFIASKHPDRNPGLLKSLLRKAIAKGIDDGLLVRPPSSVNSKSSVLLMAQPPFGIVAVNWVLVSVGKAMTGHFKVSKERAKETEKPAGKNMQAHYEPIAIIELLICICS